MNRSLQWLFNGLVAISLPASILWLALWPFSFFRKIYAVRTNQQSNLVLAFPNGYFIGTYQSGPGMAKFISMSGTPPQSWEFGCAPRMKVVPIVWDLTLQPLYLHSTNPAATINRQVLAIPLWLLAFVSGIPWASRRLWQRIHYRPIGMCPTCGYDLRATPDRCPECGQVPEKVKSLS